MPGRASSGSVSGPPRRDRGRGRAGLDHRASHLAQPPDHGVPAVHHAGDPVRVVHRHRDHHRRHVGLRVRATRHHAAAAQPGQQGHRLGAGAQRELAVHAALEPVGRLAVQLVPTAHLGRAPGIEMSRLDHQVGRGFVDLGGQAAHGAGHGDRPGGIGDQDVLRVQGPDHVIEGLQPLPRPRPPHHDLAGQLGPVEGVQRLAELQHQVVGHVHGERHRPHAAAGQPDPHPQRGAGLRGEAAHLAQHEPVAGGRVVDPGRVDVRADEVQRPAQQRRIGQRGRGRIGEGHAVRAGQLAGQPAHGHRVAAVGRHRDLQHLVAQVRVRHEIRAQRRVGRQHQDAAVIVADGQLAGRADHPLRDVAVRPARADLEPAGQDRPGQRERDPVADGEVGRAADHPGRLVRRSVELRLGHGDPAVPDRLLQPGQLLDREHLGDHHAADVMPDGLQRLDLQAGGGQPPCHLVHVDRLGQPRVLAQPGKRHTHLRSPSRTPG